MSDNDISKDEPIRDTTQFWGGPDPKIRWQDFRWCPRCQTREIQKGSEMCQDCANKEQEKEYWAIEDQKRLDRHRIHMWWISGEQNE